MANFIFRNAEIGGLDAEYDTFLDACFIETPIYSSLVSFNSSELDFNKRIIIGRTGSGKTALLKHLANDDRIKKHSKIEAESMIFEHIKNNTFVNNLIQSKIDLRIFYKSLWLHALLIETVKILYPKENNFLDSVKALLTTKSANTARLANDYIEKFSDSFFNDKVISEITERMQADLKGTIGTQLASLSGGATTEITSKIQSETAKYVNTELLKKQKELISILAKEHHKESQHRLLISIDDLDKSWLSSSDIRYDFINALLDAFKELLDIRTVKILISIRTDIFKGVYSQNLRQGEKDKSLIFSVTWSEKDIREMLDKRIHYLIKDQYQGRKVATFKDIFNFRVNDTDADQYVINRTMLRPRDAIDFVNICFKEADGSTVLQEDHVLIAEEKFYKSRKDALIKEWISIYPNIEVYIDILSNLILNKFILDDLKNYSNEILELGINSNTPDPIIESCLSDDFRPIVDVWFTVGLIGIYKKESLIIYSSFEMQNLDLTDYKKTFYIHPLFYRY